jgi:hypothetical protein
MHKRWHVGMFERSKIKKMPTITRIKEIEAWQITRELTKLDYSYHNAGSLPGMQV